jgi:hypothetical protein
MLIFKQGALAVPFDHPGKVNPKVTIFLEISANSAALIDPEIAVARKVMID